MRERRSDQSEEKGEKGRNWGDLICSELGDEGRRQVRRERPWVEEVIKEGMQRR